MARANYEVNPLALARAGKIPDDAASSHPGLAHRALSAGGRRAGRVSAAAQLLVM